MKIKKGNSFVCIKNVVMNKAKNITYEKGYLYLSEADECITNKDLDVKHNWPKGTHPKRFFVKLKNN